MKTKTKTYAIIASMRVVSIAKYNAHFVIEAIVKTI